MPLQHQFQNPAAQIGQPRAIGGADPFRQIQCRGDTGPVIVVISGKGIAVPAGVMGAGS
ncbi:hypothetical protein ACFQ4K_00950 [Tistrella bauzanensis]